MDIKIFYKWLKVGAASDIILPCIDCKDASRKRKQKCLHAHVHTCLRVRPIAECLLGDHRNVESHIQSSCYVNCSDGVQVRVNI